MKPERLPKGIYFEAARGRFRVRLYKRSTAVYLSYHSTLDEAVAALTEARRAVARMRVPQSCPLTFTQDLSSLDQHVKALLGGLHGA
jgi:hypothetical protein